MIGWRSPTARPVCGKTGAVRSRFDRLPRDLDFYTYTLTDPVAVVQAHVTGEFVPDVWLLAGQCFADPAGRHVRADLFARRWPRPAGRPWLRPR